MKMFTARSSTVVIPNTMCSVAHAPPMFTRKESVPARRREIAYVIFFHLISSWKCVLRMKRNTEVSPNRKEGSAKCTDE